MASGSGTPEDPWTLNTPLGKAEFEMHRDEEENVLHCQVGSTWLLGGFERQSCGRLVRPA